MRLLVARTNMLLIDHRPKREVFAAALDGEIIENEGSSLGKGHSNAVENESIKSRKQTAGIRHTTSAVDV